MIAWLVGLALAADPSALRQITSEGPLVEVSSEAVGVAGQLGELRLGLSYAAGAHVALSVGRHWTLLGAEQAWGLEAVAAGSVVGLTATPGVALGLTGEVRAGARGHRGQATLGLVVPLAARLDLPLDLAAPVVLEGRLVGAIGPLWVGTRGQVGATFAPGGPPAARLVGAVFVELRR